MAPLALLTATSLTATQCHLASHSFYRDEFPTSCIQRAPGNHHSFYWLDGAPVDRDQITEALLEAPVSRGDVARAARLEDSSSDLLFGTLATAVATLGGLLVDAFALHDRGLAYVGAAGGAATLGTAVPATVLSERAGTLYEGAMDAYNTRAHETGDCPTR